MAVRVTYIAIAIGGACGALAALVGSPSAPSETAPPLQGMNGLNGLPLRPIGQIAAQTTTPEPSTVQSAALSTSGAALSAPAPSPNFESATPAAASTAAVSAPMESSAVASATAAPTAPTPLPAWETAAPPGDKESLLHSEMRCDQKDAPNCILAARAYEGGTAGVTDTAKAEKYRRIALTLWISQCDHNSAASCAILAEMYRAGRGVPQNEKTAVALILRAKELCRYNDVPACHGLPAQ